MPRKAKEIKCNETDIKALQSIAGNPMSDPRLSQRATAILLCIQGKENKDVAEELGVRKNTVGDWRNAYIINGLNGLKDKKRPGRRGNGNPDKRELVKQLVKQEPEEGSKWTAQALADAAGTSVDTVHRALREEGIALERRTVWNYPSNNYNAPKTVGLAGIYLSNNGKAVIIATSNDDSLDLEKGMFVTKSGPSASRLEEMLDGNGYVTIADALEALSDNNHAIEVRPRKHPGLQEYINGIAAATERRERMTLHAIVLPPQETEQPSLTCRNITITTAPDFESWLMLISLWIDPLCGESGARIRSVLSQYTDKQMASRTPVIWRADIADQSTVSAPNRKDQPHQNDDFSDPSIENILNISASIVSRDGNKIYREVAIPNGVPGLEEIRYDSPLDLGASVGKLEQAVSSGMMGVAKQICEGYMERALKKTLKSE